MARRSLREIANDVSTDQHPLPFFLPLRLPIAAITPFPGSRKCGAGGPDLSPGPPCPVKKGGGTPGPPVYAAQMYWQHSIQSMVLLPGVVAVAFRTEKISPSRTSLGKSVPAAAMTL